MPACDVYFIFYTLIMTVSIECTRMKTVLDIEYVSNCVLPSSTVDGDIRPSNSRTMPVFRLPSPAPTSSSSLIAMGGRRLPGRQRATHRVEDVTLCNCRHREGLRRPARGGRRDDKISPVVDASVSIEDTR